MGCQGTTCPSCKKRVQACKLRVKQDGTTGCVYCVK